MQQVIFGGYYDLLSASATEYNALQGGCTWFGTEANRYKLVSTGGKIKNLRVKLDDSPGAGKHYDFTLMVDGVPSALTVEIADAETSKADTTHEVDVVAGQTVSLQCAPDGTPTVRHATWNTIFEGSTAKESLILGGSSNSVSNAATEYLGAHCAYSTWRSSENESRQVCPTAGKIKNLYVKLSTDPGIAPDAYRFTLRVNGADSDDGEGNPLQVTITADDTTGNDTTHEITVAPGDVLTMKCEPLNGPSAAPFAQMGMTFVADTDGESIVLSGSMNVLRENAGTEYIYLQASRDDDWTATEAQRYQLGQLCTLKKLYILLNAPPGVGDSFRFTLRKPGNGQADGNLTVLISGSSATTGSDTEHTDEISDDDYVDLECTTSGSPFYGKRASWGLVCFIAAAVNYDRSAAVSIGSKVTASRLLGIDRDSSVIIGNLVSASKSWNRTILSLVVVGVLVSALRIRGKVITSSVAIGNLVSASRAIGITRASSVLIGNLVTASRAIAYVRSSAVIVGNLVSASRAIVFTRSSTVIVGVVVSASRTIGVIRASLVIVGVLVTATFGKNLTILAKLIRKLIQLESIGGGGER